MNKRGFAFLYAMMIGILLFFFGMAIAPALNDTAIEVMGESQLNCSNPDLTTPYQVVCTQVDFFMPLFIGLVFGIAGFVISGIAL